MYAEYSHPIDWATVETRAIDEIFRSFTIVVGVGCVLSDHTIKSYKFI